MDVFIPIRYKLFLMVFLLIGISGIVGYVLGERIGKKTSSSIQQATLNITPTAILQPTTAIPPNTPFPLPNRFATGHGSYAITTSISGQMKFVSPKLGISFIYPGSFVDNETPKRRLDDTWTVKEVGNKVYLYNSTSEAYTDGFYLEFFNKSPQGSLETAIKKTILAAYSESDCFVKNDPPNETLPNLVSARLWYPGYKTPRPLPPIAVKCPRPYFQGDDSEYFIMDKNHLDKFVFIHAGGGDIGTEAGTWDSTIEFLP